MTASYFYKRDVIDEKDTKKLSEYMSAINRSEPFVRECVLVSITEIMEGFGICSYSNEQIRGITQFLETYVEKGAEVEKIYKKLKK